MIKIFCRFQFEAFHHWPNAPEQHRFLSYPHRHVFHVELQRKVTHGNRDIEFIDWKRKAATLVAEQVIRRAEEVSSWSCEHWAEWMIKNCDADVAIVSEDNENGAIVTKE